MRYGLFSTCSAALLGAFVSAGPASAQGRPTWVDPPAKADPSPKVDPSLKADPASKPASPAGAPSVATESGPQGSASPSVQPDAATAEARTPSAGERTAEAAPRVRGRTRQAGSAGRRPYRRLSQVPPAPLAITVAPGMAAASADRFPEWAAKAQGLNEDYLDAVSAPGDGMVAAAPRFYGERVRFHGRTMSLAALMAEKRRFVRRWPERRYVVQDGSPRTACSAATASCIVRSTFDFRADNPRAGARSQGVAELVLEISFAGPRPVIVAESSRVLRRYAPGAVSAAPASQRGA